MAGIEWPPDFFPLPGIPGAVHKPEARACSKCGAWDFLIVMTAAGVPSVQCGACVKLRAGDRVLGTLDRRKWVVRPNPRERQT